MNKLLIKVIPLITSITLPAQSLNKREILANHFEEKKISVKAIPEDIFQGETALIQVSTNRQLNKPYYLFNGKSCPLFKDNDSTYSGYFGTTPDYKDSKIIVTDSSNNFIDTLIIKVKEKFFARQGLPESPPPTRIIKEGEDILPPEVLRKAKIAREENELVKKAINSESYADFGNQIPYKQPTKGRITTEYGAERKKYVEKRDTIFTKNGKRIRISYVPTKYFHNGIDIGAPLGQAMMAMADGKVIFARPLKESPNGWIIIIDHGRSQKSAYLHLSGLNVREGDTVKRGQLIGKVGKSGYSFGAHAHIGTYIHGIYVNPEPLTEQIEKSPKVIARYNQQTKTVKKTFADTCKYAKDTTKNYLNSSKGKSTLNKARRIIK